MSVKRALVCGASQGIGAAVAQELAKSKFKLTLVSRNREALEEQLSQLPGEGHTLLVADFNEPSQWMSALEKEHGIHPYLGLFCNAGGPPGGAISQADPEDFLKAMSLHLGVNSRLVKFLLPAMKEAGWGRVVTMTSTSVKVPIPHLGVSNTVRAAVASWAKTLSLEVAPFGITVNNVMPGFTETPRLQNLIKAQSQSLGQDEEQVREAWKKKVPMGRFCKPEEIAYMVDFLFSEKSAAMTGQNIAVDGGRLGCL